MTPPAAVVEIRRLEAGDEAVLSAAVELADEGPLDPHSATDHLRDPALVAVAALEGGRVIGFLYGHVLRRFGVKTLLIYSVDVEENRRRRGVGRALMASLEEAMRAGGWDEMFVVTNSGNAAAMALYAAARGVRPYRDEAMFDFAPSDR